MGCLSVVIGFLMLGDAFSAHTWGGRQWAETVVALVLIFGGWVVNYFEEG